MFILKKDLDRILEAEMRIREKRNRERQRSTDKYIFDKCYPYIDCYYYFLPNGKKLYTCFHPNDDPNKKGRIE